MDCLSKWEITRDCTSGHKRDRLWNLKPLIKFNKQKIFIQFFYKAHSTSQRSFHKYFVIGQKCRISFSDKNSHIQHISWNEPQTEITWELFLQPTSPRHISYAQQEPSHVWGNIKACFIEKPIINHVQISHFSAWM